jgi:hypothetical protein
MPYGDEELGYDDDFGDDDDDEYGLTERRAAKLIRRRAKLEALLPVVRPHRQKKIAKRMQRIDRILAKSGYTADQQGAADLIAASGIEGVGGLMFQAESPPGLGRLVRLPFYPTVPNADTTTSAGLAAASATNPVFIDGPVALATSAGVHALTTPQISWALLRIVGFETQSKMDRLISTSGPLMLVSDLQIGGGANLFTHEDFADATIYDADQPEFAGLRDYPILRSPNTATVSVQQVGNLDSESITFSCAILAEVLIDDNYGAHIPGPYARKGALVRQGGSFVG